MADTRLSELKFCDDTRIVCLRIIFKIARSKTFFGKEVKERGGPELISEHKERRCIEFNAALYYITVTSL